MSTSTFFVYIVNTYRPDTKTRVRDRSPNWDGYIHERIEVAASSALEAVKIAGFDPAKCASVTSRYQNDADAAVRDNVHVQTNHAGHVGASAVRKGYEVQPGA